MPAFPPPFFSLSPAKPAGETGDHILLQVALIYLNRGLKFLCLLNCLHACFCAREDSVSLVFKQKLLLDCFDFSVLSIDRALSQRDSGCSADVPVQRQWPRGHRCPKMEFAALWSWRFCLGACVHCCSLQGQPSEQSLHKLPHVILLE